MKLRHAATLALVGWYFMIPPLDDKHNPQTDLPISQWWQHQAFDSAKECEDSKDAYMRKYESNSKKDEKAKAFWVGMMGSVVQGFCVATDDPRLKPN
jgi:hypothetical protein